MGNSAVNTVLSHDILESPLVSHIGYEMRRKREREKERIRGKERKEERGKGHHHINHSLLRINAVTAPKAKKGIERIVRGENLDITSDQIESIVRDNEGISPLTLLFSSFLLSLVPSPLLSFPSLYLVFILFLQVIFGPS